MTWIASCGYCVRTSACSASAVCLAAPQVPRSAMEYDRSTSKHTAADARLSEDHLGSAKKIWAGAYSDNVLEVIDWCLRLDPLERPQSVFALQKAIRDIAPRKRKLTFLDTIKKRLFSEMT